MIARIMWYILSIPVHLLAFIYIALLVIEYVGERAEAVADRMLDSSLRQRYLTWVEKVSGYKR